MLQNTKNKLRGLQEREPNLPSAGRFSCIRQAYTLQSKTLTLLHIQHRVLWFSLARAFQQVIKSSVLKSECFIFCSDTWQVADEKKKITISRSAVWRHVGIAQKWKWPTNKNSGRFLQRACENMIFFFGTTPRPFWPDILLSIRFLQHPPHSERASRGWP